MKYLTVLGFIAILSSLGAALFFMMKGGVNDINKKMATALGLRVSLSIFLFLCILLFWKLGYIQPTGISAGQ